MESFLVFLSKQWLLVAAWLSLVALYFYHESRRGGTGVTPQVLSVLVNQQDATVLDVRDHKEFQKGHIVDAVNIPHTQVKERLGELESRQDKPVIVVCQHGQHAGAVGKLLRSAGFESVYRLQGGISEWRNARLPLVRE